MRISDWSSDVCSSGLSKVEAGVHTAQLDVGVRGKNFWVASADYQRAKVWFSQGYTEALKTPDDTIVYVTPESRAVIQQDQKDCMGCLPHCQFSSWTDHDDYTTRSAERRVGKEWVSTGRSRWCP